MAYALLDDGFHSNPKLLAVGLAGMGLYAAALSYCGQYGTDGIVPMAWVVQRAGKQKNLPELLVEHHLWERVDVGDRVQLLDRNRAEIVAKIKQPAYLIRDFLEYNLSATQVREKREAKARAGSAGAKSKWQKAQQTYDSSHDTEMAAAIANDMANAEQKVDSPRAQPLPLPQGNPLPVPEPLPKDAARDDEAEAQPGTAPASGVGQPDHAAGSNGAGAGSGHEAHSNGDGDGDLALAKLDVGAELARFVAVDPGDEPA